jgi:hypothetical protein
MVTPCSAPPTGRSRRILELVTTEIVNLTEHARQQRKTVRWRGGGQSQVVVPRHRLRRGQSATCNVCFLARLRESAIVVERLVDKLSVRAVPESGSRSDPLDAGRLLYLDHASTRCPRRPQFDFTTPRAYASMKWATDGT